MPTTASKALETPWIKLDPQDDAIIAEIEAENARGAALIAAALADERLLETIKLRLRPEALSAPDRSAHGLLFRRGGGLATNFARIQLGHLMQIYPPQIAQLLEAINKIRNKFAHETAPISFKTPKIVKLCGPIALSLPSAMMAADLFLRTATGQVRNPRARTFAVPGNRFSVTLGFAGPSNARDIYMQCIKLLLFVLAWARDVYANEFVVLSPPPLPGTRAKRSPSDSLRRTAPGKGRQRRPRSSRP